MSFIDNVTKTVRQVGDVVKKSYGPLDALSGDKEFAGTQYRYPLEVGDTSRYPHTVEFQAWLPVTRPISEVGLFKPVAQGIGQVNDRLASTLGSIKNGIGGLVDKAIGKAQDVVQKNLPAPIAQEINNYGADALEGMKVNANQKYNDRMFDWQRRAEKSDLFAMYMPSGGWQDQVTNQYEQVSMTNAMGAAGLVLEAGGSILKEWQESGGAAAWTQAKELANGPAGAEVLGNVASALPGGMDGATLGRAGLSAMGYAINPQFEMLYAGTDLRSFLFDFTMTPRDEKEAETIRKIIKRFKYHASPAYVAGQGRYIIPPSYFDITFNFNGTESKWLPSISTCVLRQVIVDYNGSGLDTWATHADGSPIQVKLTLEFVELEMMHKKLRKLGY
jgi:hypothetical protein